MDIQFNRNNLKGFVDEKDYKAMWPKLQKAHEDLEQKTGKGSAFTGWTDLPSRTKDEFLEEIKEIGNEIRERSDCLICVGIGGSYLGARASLEFLISEQKIPVYFAGHNLSSGYLYFLLVQILMEQHILCHTVLKE